MIFSGKLWLQSPRDVGSQVAKAKLAARFAGCVLMDARSNAIFPHADKDGPCGYEIKNRGFTGFAPGGERGCGSRVCNAPIPWS